MAKCIFGIVLASTKISASMCLKCWAISILLTEYLSSTPTPSRAVKKSRLSWQRSSHTAHIWSVQNATHGTQHTRKALSRKWRPTKSICKKKWRWNSLCWQHLQRMEIPSETTKCLWIFWQVDYMFNLSIRYGLALQNYNYKYRNLYKINDKVKRKLLSI